MLVKHNLRTLFFKHSSKLVNLDTKNNLSPDFFLLTICSQVSLKKTKILIVDQMSHCHISPNGQFTFIERVLLSELTVSHSMVLESGNGIKRSSWLSKSQEEIL